MEESTLINVMIDPSLVVVESTMDKTFDLIKEYHKTQNFKFYLPKTFQSLAVEDKLHQESLTFKFFQQSAYPTEITIVKTLISDLI